MPNANCVPRDTLKQYLVGAIDERYTHEIESHLELCEDCERTIIALEADPDTLLESVREAGPGRSVHGFTAGRPTDDPLTDAEIPSVIERAVAAARRIPSTSMALPVPPMVLTQIGAYDLIRPLGRGGMGLVVLARHRSLHKEVAIKLLTALAGDRTDLVTRFQREMRTAGRLNHPSIVNATDAGQEQGTHYLVMEFIDGLDLSRIARLTGPLSIADASELVRQAAIGLSHAHAEGVVHRDIKPSNLMLDTAGRVKILDFGLAQLSSWDETACELTTVGQLMGTLDYMAPEQAERSAAVDYRADLYALGATLFRLIAGRAPLAAAPNMTLLEKVRLLGAESAPSLASFREDCPQALVELVKQLLSRDPANRPASAAHVAEALQPFCEGHQLVDLLARARVSAARSVASDVAESAVASAPVLQYVSDSRTSLPPRRRWPWVLLALAPLCAWAAILITLETQKGQLVIQSEVAGVHIKVAHDGRIVDELIIQPGAQSTRLRADKYEILIDSPSDQIVCDKQQFSIKNGETVVATVKQNERQLSIVANQSQAIEAYKSEALNQQPPRTAMNTTLNSNTRPLSSVAPDNPRLTRLLDLLNASDSLDLETATQHLRSIERLANRDTAEMIRPIVLRKIKVLSAASSDPKKLARSELSQVAFRILSRIHSADQYKTFLLDECNSGSSKWQQVLFGAHVVDIDTTAWRFHDQEWHKLNRQQGEWELISFAIERLANSPAIEGLSGDAAVQEQMQSFLCSALIQESNYSRSEEIFAALKKLGEARPEAWLNRSPLKEPVPSLRALRIEIAKRVFANLSSSPELSLRATLTLQGTSGQSAEILPHLLRRVDLLLKDKTRRQNWTFLNGMYGFLAEFPRSGQNRPFHIQLPQTIPMTGLGSNELLELLDLLRLQNYAVQPVQVTLTSIFETLEPDLHAVLPVVGGKDVTLSLSWPTLDAIVATNADADYRHQAKVWNALTPAQRADVLAAVDARDFGEKTEDIPDVGDINSPQHAYADVSLSTWLSRLALDTRPEEQLTCLKAILALSKSRSIDAATPPVISILRNLSESATTDSDMDKLMRDERVQSGFNILRLTGPGYYDLLVDNLRRGPARWQRLLLRGSTSKQKISEINLQGQDKLFREAVSFVSDPILQDKQLVEAAADYLLQGGTSGRVLEPFLVRDAGVEALNGLAVVLRSGRFNADFWLARLAVHEKQADIRKVILRKANESFADLNSTPELSMHSILAVQADATLELGQFIEPRMNQLLADKNRLTRLYSFKQDDQQYLELTRLTANSTQDQNFSVDNDLGRNEFLELLKMVKRYNLSSSMRPSLQRVADALAADANATESFIKDVAFVPESGLVVQLESVDKWNQLPNTQKALGVIIAAAQRLLQSANAPTSEELPSKDGFLDTDEIVAARYAPSASKRTANPPTTEMPANAPHPTAAIYDGRTLAEWLTILEKDREIRSRIVAAKAIAVLAKGGDVEATSTRLLAIAKQSPEGSDSAELLKFLRSVHVHPAYRTWENNETLDYALFHCLRTLNSEAEFEQLLANRLLTGEDAWMVRWYTVLVKSRDTFRPGSSFDTALLTKESFDRYGADTATCALAYYIFGSLLDETFAKQNIATVIELTLNNRHLGKQSVLLIDCQLVNTISPVLINHTLVVTSNLVLPGKLIVEEAVAVLAKQVLSDDQSTPEELALASGRLATTTGLVDQWREELLNSLRKRLHQLSGESERLAMVLPRLDNGQLGTLTARNYFPEDAAKVQFVNAVRYVNSEPLSYIVLAKRLSAASDLSNELAAVLQATSRAWIEIQLLETRQQPQRSPTWPFDPEMLRSQNAPLASTLQSHWVQWHIQNTINELIDAGSRHSPAAIVSERAWAGFEILQLDKDRDQSLAVSELPDGTDFEDTNGDGQIDVDELIGSWHARAVKQSAFTPEQVNSQIDWATKQIAKYDQNGDGLLTPNEWSKMIIKPDAADSNGDGKINAEEYWKFRQRRQ